VPAGERDLEKAAAIPVSPSLASEPGDRQEVTVPSSPPVLAGERDLEKAAAIPVSPSLAPEAGDRQEVTVPSSPPALAGERDLEKAAAIPVSPSLAQGQVGREEAAVRPMFPSIAHKQVDREQPVASLPAFVQRQLDPEEGYGSSQPGQGLNRQRRYRSGAPYTEASRRCEQRRGGVGACRNLRSFRSARTQSLWLHAGCRHGARLVRKSDRAWCTSGATAARNVNSKVWDALKQRPRPLTVRRLCRCTLSSVASCLSPH